MAVSRLVLEWWRRIDARLTPRLILAIAWSLFFVYAYPGYLSPDSVLQLLQGRSGYYTDGHPPLMAWLWGRLDAIVAGPLLMLVLQSGAFLFGAAALFRHVMSRRTAALCAGALLLFPPVLTTMAVIWKDSQMAGYLIAGTACLLSGRRWVRLAGCGWFVLACAMRVNAPAAVLPIAIALFEWRGGLRWYKRYAIAAAVAFAITLTALGINRALADERQQTWANGAALHDIAGIVRYARRSFSDAQLERLLAGTQLRATRDIAAQLRRFYDPSNYYDLNHGEHRVFEEMIQPHQIDALRRAWRQLVFDYPRPYLYHRYQVARGVLGLEPRVRVWAAVWDGFGPEGTASLDAIGVTYTHSEWQRWWVRSLMDIEQTSLLFRPYMYLFLALLVLPLCLRSRLELGLLAGGLACELSIFIGAATPDFRYSHWMIVTVIAACVIAFTRRFRSGRVVPESG